LRFFFNCRTIFAVTIMLNAGLGMAKHPCVQLFFMHIARDL
jgi:hypothetical protein